MSTEELRVLPFTDVTLTCRFSSVEGTENLEFSWEREDIKEEYGVEDNKLYYHFLRCYGFFEFSQGWFTSFIITLNNWRIRGDPCIREESPWVGLKFLRDSSTFTKKCGFRG